MDKNWKEQQLNLLGSKDSIFKYIPEELGNILYCDTDNPNKVPLSAQEARKKKIIGSCISIILLIGYWGFLYDHYIWGIIFTIVVVFFTIGFCATNFVGKDYFVGEKGFAIVYFSDNRTNITEKEIVLFEDLSYLFTGETVIKQNFSYFRTDYYFSLYKKLDSDGQHYDVAYNAVGSYSDKAPKDVMNPKGAHEQYCMLKKVEQVWTLFFFEHHRFDSEISFPLLEDKTILEDALVFKNNSICVNGINYDKSNTKRIYFSDGQLVFEHENHSKKFFGLVEKGNISKISLSGLGNRRAFLMLFDSIYKS